MCHESALSSQLLLLLFGGRFFGGRPLGGLLPGRGLRFPGRGLGFGVLGCLRRLRLFPGQFGSGKFLAVEGDLGDTHRGESLAVSAQLLVLLFALVVEHEDLGAAALLDHFAHYACFPRLCALPFAAGNGKHIVELHGTFGARALSLDSNYVAGRNPVLLATGADDRVHSSASVKINPRRTLARCGNLLNFLCLLCSPRRGSRRRKRAAPERNRRYRQTRLFYRALWKLVKPKRMTRL